MPVILQNDTTVEFYTSLTSSPTFLPDNHGAVAENTDSTWEEELRLSQVSSKYTGRNSNVYKALKMS